MTDHDDDRPLATQAGKGLRPAPDFDQIARDSVSGSPSDPLWNTIVAGVAEQLRQVWNARGAADIAKLESFRLFPEDPDVAVRATRKTIDRALRSLDR